MKKRKKNKVERVGNRGFCKIKGSYVFNFGMFVFWGGFLC